jgi:tetratricopeptide (TPR) repeat protein
VLGRLVGRGFLRPASSTFADQVAFRFRHILIRDAAYGTTPKKVRARLHEGLADWVESVAGDRQPEFEEILGFHLEGAYLQLMALGRIDAHGFELADRAAGKLSSAGRRNFARGNVPAASNLLARAADLIPQAADRVPVLVDLAEVLARGGDVASSTRISADVVRLADEAGDQASRSYAMLSYILTAVFPFVHHWVPHDEALAEIESAIDLFKGTGDERGLARAYAALDVVDQTSGRGNQMRSALEASFEHARRANSEREEVWALGRLCITSVWDATPVDEAAERCIEVLSHAADRPLTRAQAQMSLAGLVAMGGDVEGGRERLAVVHEIHRELGSPMQAISHTAPMAAYIAFWAGDFETAERAVRPAFEAVERFGAPSTSRWMAALLADALCGMGDLEQAELVSRKAFEGLPADHRQAQIDWRIPRSRILAQMGQEEEGERLAREAVAIASETDFLLHQTLSLVALIDVLIFREMWSEAKAALADAFKVCDRKRAPGLAAYAAAREPLLRDRS